MSAVRPELLWVVPVLAALALFAARRRAGRRRALRTALRAPGPVATPLRDLLTCGAALACGAAAAGVAWRERDAAGSPPPPRVVLLVDASRSMATRDVAPDRAARLRATAGRLLVEADLSTAGLVAFGPHAASLLPAGARAEVALRQLGALDSEALAPGTALAPAIGLGVAALPPVGGSAREGGGSLVLLTDGETGEPPAELEEAARDARAAGVRVHAVVVGTEAGGPVPGAGPGATSRAHPELLRRVAEAGGGRLAWASDPGSIRALAAELRGGEPGTETGMQSGSNGRGGWVDAAPALALVALALLLAETLLGAARPWRVA